MTADASHAVVSGESNNDDTASCSIACRRRRLVNRFCGGASMLFHDGEGPLVVLARVTLAGVRHARTDSGGGGGRASGGELLLMTED